MCSARQSGIKTSGSLETWKVPGMWLTRSQVECPRPAGCLKARGRRALLKLHGVSSPSLGLRCPVSRRAVPAYPSETRKSQAGTKARLDGSQGGREENLLQDTSLGRRPLQTIFHSVPTSYPSSSERHTAISSPVHEKLQPLPALLAPPPGICNF